MRNRLALLLALLSLALWAPGLAHAEDGGNGGDNAAVAINTKDGSSLFKFAFSIRKVLGDVVDNENAAVAYASCESCRTTAIAIQIVFVVGSPTTVTPANYAIALNESCTLCQTFASAYQFVIGVPSADVGFTKAGKHELKAILKEFRALKKEDYTAEEFKAKTDALAARLRTVLKTQLVTHREEGDDEEDPGDEQETDEEQRPAPPPATTEAGTTSTGGTTSGTTTTPATTGGTTTGATTTGTTTSTEPATTTTTTTP